MLMTEMPIEGQPPVDAYGPGGFRVRETWHDGAVMITPEGGVVAMPDGFEAGLDRVMAEGAIDAVVLGQGPDIAPLPRALRERLDATSIGYEHMATPAACRTYNVMLAEDRRVAALLLPI
ncbi:MAG: Mth938-like domain-containing protein [Paracoccaceae bacterium]